jgi:hypothetical protein
MRIREKIRNGKSSANYFNCLLLLFLYFFIIIIFFKLKALQLKKAIKGRNLQVFFHWFLKIANINFNMGGRNIKKFSINFDVILDIKKTSSYDHIL